MKTLSGICLLVPGGGPSAHEPRSWQHERGFHLERARNSESWPLHESNSEAFITALCTQLEQCICASTLRRPPQPPTWPPFLARTAVTSSWSSARASTACISCSRALGGLLALIGSCGQRLLAAKRGTGNRHESRRRTLKHKTLAMKNSSTINTYNHSNQQQQLWCRHAHRRGVPP